MRIKVFLIIGLLGLEMGCSSSGGSKIEAKKQEPPPVAASKQEASPSAKEVSKEAPKKDEIVCKFEKESRNIELEPLEAKGCTVWYTSFGNRKKVAWSHNGREHCESVRERMKKNLEGAGYQCYTVEKSGADAPVKASAAAEPAKSK